MGAKVAIEKVIKILKKHFTVKVLGELKEYVGCQIIRKGDQCWLYQPELLQKMKMEYWPKVMNFQEYATPLPAKSIMLRALEGDKLLSESKQKEYRSGVGSLLYLVKLSRPDLANCTRELSKIWIRPQKDTISCY